MGCADPAEACTWSLRAEGPKRFGAPNDRAPRNRTEISPIKGCWRVRVHEKDFGFCDGSTALPDRQWATEPVMGERHADLGPIDADGELTSAHRSAGKRNDVLDEWHPKRQVLALGEKRRERRRWHGDHKIADGEIVSRLDPVEPNRHARRSIPYQTRHRPRTDRERHGRSTDEQGSERCGASHHGETLCLCSHA